MSKFYSGILIFILLFGCSSVKQSQKALNSGDYDTSIDKAVKNLRNNKNKKGNQAHIILLEKAYQKANQRDLQRIDYLKNDSNPSYFQEIFDIYNDLEFRQNIIKPLLPLYIANENRNANFSFTDYSADLLKSKKDLSDYLYKKSKNTLSKAVGKIEYRRIFEDLEYLSKINPNYRDVNSLMDEAKFKGTNFVYVSLNNKTDKVIPNRLEDYLLNFDTYRLDDFWNEYHINMNSQINYDFEIAFSFVEINISPEQIKEKEIIREKTVEDGWRYALDGNNQKVKDSLGNYIKETVYKDLKCRLNLFTQFKAVNVIAQIEAINLHNNQLQDTFPLSSEFIFENQYATFRGNKEALSDEEKRLIKNHFIHFPSNEQMIFDSGEDIKKRFKSILKRVKYR